MAKLVIIPYKLDDGEQLKHTIRSINEHYHDYEIILSGDKPDWYTGAYIARDGKEYTYQLDSEINITRGLEVAKSAGQKTAILWHDDTIAFTNEIEFNDEYECTLDELAQKKPPLRFWCSDTKKLLNLYNSTHYAYTLHRPYEVNIDEYLKISYEIVQPNLRQGHNIPPRCIYSNLTNKKHTKATDYNIYTDD